MNCNNCLCPKFANSACSNHGAYVCDIEENKYYGVENPSCLVGVCTGFKEKKGD